MSTMIYLTNRRDCCVDWLVNSYCTQIEKDYSGAYNDDWVFVDFYADQPERKEQFLKVVNGRFPFRHVTPKPTPWQGQYRLTKDNWFAASNSRNTGLLLARHPYAFCIDDLSVFDPAWLSNARHAERHGYVVAGSYWKVKGLSVDDKGLISGGDRWYLGRDSRWDYGKDGIVQVPANLLYGCSFGIPLWAVEKVHGFPEKCDGMGSEDSIFGIYLSKIPNMSFYYNRNMLTLEHDEMHFIEKAFRRESRLCQNGIMSDYEILNDAKSRVQSDNSYDFTQLRELVKNASVEELNNLWPKVNSESRDWATGKHLSEL